jgi:RHS repeat-associated protein
VSYTSFGKISAEKLFDRNGSHVYTLEKLYNDQEQLISETDAEGHVTQYGYDHLGRLILILDDFRKDISYDSADQIIEIKTPEKITMAYDAKGRLVSESDFCGNLTRYTYDALDRVIETTYADGTFTKKRYDALGNVVTVTDEDDYQTHYKYNLLGKCIECRRSDGTKELWEYDACGREVSHTLPTGAVIKTDYTPLDQVASIETVGVRKETQVWKGSLLIEKHSPRGLVTKYIYNSLGEVISKEVGDRITHLEYDSLGRLFKKTQGDIVEHTFYDNLGNVIREETPYSWKEYSYDARENKIQEKTFDGTWEHRYDAHDNLISSTDPLGNTTIHTYSWYKQKVVTTTSPKGIQTIKTYDCKDREIRKEIKHLHLEEKQYDGRGNLVHHTITPFEEKKPKEALTHTWKYGPENQLLEFKESGRASRLYTYHKGLRVSKTKCDGKTINYEYDLLGRKTRQYGEDLDEIFEYDEEDNLVRAGGSKRTYNLHGDLVREELANGHTVSHIYNSLGQKIRTQHPQRPTIHYSYKNGELEAIRFGDQHYSYLKRDQRGRVTQDSHSTYKWDALGRLIEKSGGDYSYGSTKFDPHGNLLSYQENGITHYYVYDDYDQLIQEPDHSYLFDSVNRKIQEDDNSFSYDKSLQQVDLKYDANGNLLEFDGWHFFYDLLDRLVKATSTKKSIMYSYDGFGRCLTKNQTRYLWDGEIEVGSDDELRVLGENNQSVFLLLKNRYYTPIHDFRGNLSRVLGTKERYTYKAFYEETSGGLVPWRFSGKRTDSDTGLIDFGKRFYVSGLGRWLTPDPSGFADGPNLYAYCLNNPLTHIDYVGLSAELNRAGGFSWYQRSRQLLDYPISAFNHPRVQGSLQAFGGLAQASMGGMMTLESGGLAAPLGWPMMAHGLDQFCAGMNTALTGRYHYTASEQLMHRAGASPGMASFANGTLSLGGAMGGGGILKASRPKRFFANFSQKNPYSTCEIGCSNLEINNRSVWTATKKKTAAQNAFSHWKAHGKEFPELLNSKQYVEKAHNFFSSRDQLLTKVRPNGEILLYDSKNNMFGAFTSKGTPKTIFKPKEGIIYWETRN